MADTNKKLFSHRGFWKEPLEQNTASAILKAFYAGFDVEVDIRLNSGGSLVTGHDTAQEVNWNKIFSCPERKMIAFHVKEKGLAGKLSSLIGDMGYLEYIIFVVSEEEKEIYTDMFVCDSIAFEYSAKIFYVCVFI